jgi:hypothetical protein
MNTDHPDDRRPPAPGAPADPDAALADALARSRVLQDAPEAVIQRAIDVFAPRQRAVAVDAPAPGGVLRRLVAVLGFDSATLTPQAAGLRSTASAVRQMLFSADGRDVDLRIAPGAGGWQVSGQVLGPDASGFVEVSCGETFHAVQAWNDLAEFRIDGVPAGRCRIVLRSSDWEMALPELTIPDEAA